MLARGAAAAPPEPEVDSLSLAQGRAAMWRSAVMDGWGQAHNGEWVKALVFSAAELSIVAGAAGQHREWRRWQDRRRRADDGTLLAFYMQREDFYLRDRNKLIWWWLWLKLAAVLDAYVSGSLSNFDAGWTGDVALGPRLAPALLGDGVPGLRATVPIPIGAARRGGR